MPYRAKSPASVIAMVGVLGGLLMLAAKASPPTSALFFVPFSLGPLLVTAAAGAFCRGRIPQVILVVAAVAYLAWFGWLYMDVFYWNPDPQSPIALVFVGVYALPVLIPMWIAAVILAIRSAARRRTSQH